MSAIGVVDLSTFCGTIGTLYRRHRLCPPFSLHDAAQGWIARGIPLTHCVDVIERYLSRHAGSCHSGSGDWNFAWLSNQIQTSWYERWFAMPYPATEQTWPHDRIRDRGADEQGFREGHRTPSAEAPRNSPGAKSAIGAVSGAMPRKSASADQIPSKCHRYRSAGKPRAPSPKKLDLAVAWLRIELADGERAAAEVEAKALCAGITPRTYDRARKRLGVISRRIGFGQWAKYVIALPTVHGTPSEGANKLGAV